MNIAAMIDRILNFLLEPIVALLDSFGLLDDDWILED